LLFTTLRGTISWNGPGSQVRGVETVSTAKTKTWGEGSHAGGWSLAWGRGGASRLLEVGPFEFPRCRGPLEAETFRGCITHHAVSPVQRHRFGGEMVFVFTKSICRMRMTIGGKGRGPLGRAVIVFGAMGGRAMGGWFSRQRPR